LPNGTGEMGNREVATFLSAETLETWPEQAGIP
jgi:hypothetical protein